MTYSNPRDREELACKVKRFLAEELGSPSEQFGAADDLRTTWGVDGDDAEELLTSFAHRFDVDLSRFHLADYFDAEIGFSPLRAIRRLIWNEPSIPIYKELTVEMLINAAVEGKLIDKGASGQRAEGQV